jgi:hypothetical protein
LQAKKKKFAGSEKESGRPRNGNLKRRKRKRDCKSGNGTRVERRTGKVLREK